ncbi:hypothetical protein [Mesorhizobium sanjuanii]|uniref:hypothetical protein n=1 Tax=Mesorhizobium sanjuanii TaxID=2037900 RepID=UPI003159AB38
MQTVTLRPGRANDVETVLAALLRLGTDSGAHKEIKSMPEDLHRHGFGDKPAFSTLIAEVDDQFAGPCLHFPWPGSAELRAVPI